MTGVLLVIAIRVSKRVVNLSLTLVLDEDDDRFRRVYLSLHRTKGNHCFDSTAVAIYLNFISTRISHNDYVHDTSP